MSIIMKNDHGDPSSIGIRNCHKVPCASRIIYGKSQQPPLCLTNPSHILLNKCSSLKPSPDFFPVRGCKDCPNSRIVYQSEDPRLLSVLRNIRTKLDRPPDEGGMCMHEIYKDSMAYIHPGTYTGYEDINAGQIKYYIDKDIAPAYFNPLFTISSNVEHSIRIDPMGGVRPEYLRCPKTQNNNNISPYQFMRDTLSHREDLMARQMARANETRWESRFAKY